MRRDERRRRVLCEECGTKPIDTVEWGPHEDTGESARWKFWYVCTDCVPIVATRREQYRAGQIPKHLDRLIELLTDAAKQFRWRKVAGCGELRTWGAEADGGCLCPLAAICHALGFTEYSTHSGAGRFARALDIPQSVIIMAMQAADNHLEGVYGDLRQRMLDAVGLKGVA